MRKLTRVGATVFALLIAACASSGPNAELKEGWELMVARDYPAARDHFEAMLAGYPDNPYVHLNLGVAYHELGQTDLARRHYELAIAEGGTAEISTVSRQGNVEDQPSTVADLARTNLDRLGG